MENNLAILLISFNRPKLTQDALASIKKIQPKKLFFAVDGPRVGIGSDQELVEACKKKIELVDWHCDVKTLFADRNYGSGEWPYRSITWSLKMVDEILVLEDDVRIEEDFYELSSLLLDKYRDDKNIFAICASNIADESAHGLKDDYFFTRYFAGWGWATWADRWEKYEFTNLETHEIEFRQILHRNKFNFLIAMYFYINFMFVKYKKIKAWDYQISQLNFSTDSINIKTTKNMSINVGTGSDATHTKYLPKMKLNKIINHEIKHPSKIEIDAKSEKRWRKARLKFLMIVIIKRIFSLR